MDTLVRPWTTPRGADALLATLHPWRGTRRRGVIEAIVPTGREAASLRIRPGLPVRDYRPGQFVTVTVALDGVRHARCFSLTSVPDDPGGRLEITVQATARPGGGSGPSVSQHLVQRARPGDVVGLSRPSGEFCLPEPADGPVLLVSGGSGVTPMMGMLRALAARPAGSPLEVVHLHYATRPERVLFAGELATLAERSPWLHQQVTITRHLDGRSVPGTRLDADGLDRHCPDWAERQAFVCGPAAMLDFAHHHWAAHGQSHRLHLEQFTPFPVRVAPAAAASTSASAASAASATFERSGVTTDVGPDATLLEAAEGAGVLAPFGCRSGICHTCSTPLLAGQVRDRRDGRIHQAGSHVQLCVGTAYGDVVLGL